MKVKELHYCIKKVSTVAKLRGAPHEVQSLKDVLNAVSIIMCPICCIKYNLSCYRGMYMQLSVKRVNIGERGGGGGGGATP